MICHLPSHKITLIDFYQLFQKQIDVKIVNNCHEHGLIKNDKISLFNKDVEKIIYHYIILESCDYLINIQNGSCIFCLTTIPSCDFELFKYTDKSKLLDFITKSVRKISRNIPISFLSIPFDDINVLCDKIKYNNGNALDTLEYIKKAINNKKKVEYSLSNAKKFTKKYDLNFLNQSYLNKLNIKMNLCTK